VAGQRMDDGRGPGVGDTRAPHSELIRRLGMAGLARPAGVYPVSSS